MNYKERAVGYENYEKWIANPVIRDFILLYMAEGAKESKRGYGSISVSNTDPLIIELCRKGCRELDYGEFSYRLILNYECDVRSEKEAWAAALSIKVDEISHTLIKVRASSTIPDYYPRHKRCVMKLDVKKSAMLFYQFLGIVDRMKEIHFGR